MGRPRKYGTAAEKAEARRAQNRIHIRKWRARKVAEEEERRGGFFTKFVVVEASALTRRNDTKSRQLASVRLSLRPLATTEDPYELASFHYFRHHALRDLHGHFKVDFWQHYVLQAYHHEAAVRHSIIALAAVHAAANTGVDLHMPFANSIDSIEEGHLTTWGLLQYNRAIKELQGPDMSEHTPGNSARSRSVALICCVLFVCIESMLDGRRAIDHMQSGIRLLRNTRSRMADSHSSYVPDTVILEMFTRMDLLGTCWIVQRRPQLVEADTKDLDSVAELPSFVLQPSRHLPLPTAFASIGEARSTFERFFVAQLYLLGPQRADLVWEEQGSPTPKEFFQPRLEWLREWQEALNAHVIGLKRSRRFERHDALAVELLGQHATIAKGMAMTGNATNLFPACLDDELRKQVDLARTSVAHMKEIGIRYSFELGSVPILYYIAMSAHDSGIRSDALDVLDSYTWQDSLWRSDFAATLVRDFKGLT